MVGSHTTANGRARQSSLSRCKRDAHITMHFVYIAKSLKDNGFYVGCTNNLKKRLNYHNSGKTRSLRNRNPLKIIYTEQYFSAEEAYNREKQIKSYKGGEAFKKLISNSN